MVTISEEFLATEQMNNRPNSEQPPAQPTAPQASPADDVPALEEIVEPHGDRHGGDNSGPEPVGQANPDEKANDNHHQDKCQPSKPKRNCEGRGSCAAANSGGAPAPQATNRDLGPEGNNSHPSGPASYGTTSFPHLEAVNRVLSLPIVDSGVNMVSGVYSRVKNVSPVVQWGLGTAEGAVLSSLGRSLSLLGPLSGPISVVDSLLCRGLDVVEYNMPIITLPPDRMMTAGRDYMSARVVTPVLRLTASNARLADTIAARALDSADQYVDKYLPGDASTENGDAGSSIKGGAALQRADRLSRKLQRRITRRTLAEARALRKDTENTLHTLVYFAETLVKDPRAFVEQCRAVWNHLSENEPENQAPPETLEERLALLVREVARRVVHLANFTAASANTRTVSHVANHVFKSVRNEGAKVVIYATSQLERMHMREVLGDVNIYTHQLLERLAQLLAALRNSSNTMGRPFPHTATNNVALVN